jgi:hypothetical protein
MKLNYAPQAGLRRRRPDRGRERAAFWGGVAIVAAFEVILMAKNWSELPTLRWPFAADAQAADDTAPSPSVPN